MKKLLVIVLTLAAVICLVVPAGALTSGDTIYLFSSESGIESATACFHDDDFILFTEVTMSDNDHDGYFEAMVPAGVTQVYFNYLPSVSTTDGVRRYTLAATSGNTLDVATNRWSVFGVPDEEEVTTEPPPADTTGDSSFSQTCTDEAGNDSATINVSGKVKEGSSAADVVSVDVVWGAMEFTYTPASKGTWDPVEHTYVQDTEGGEWTPSGNTITVTNHSNVGITASFGFVPSETLGVVGEFRDENQTAVTSVDLETADNGQNGEAGEATAENVTFHITGGSIETDTASLGTITVTISKQP